MQTQEHSVGGDPQGVEAMSSRYVKPRDIRSDAHERLMAAYLASQLGKPRPALNALSGLERLLPQCI